MNMSLRQHNKKYMEAKNIEYQTKIFLMLIYIHLENLADENVTQIHM
jgi:hypothetical protein